MSENARQDPGRSNLECKGVLKRVGNSCMLRPGTCALRVYGVSWRFDLVEAAANLNQVMS